MWVVMSLLIGLGIFLYGMHRLENGLQSLGSDRVRTWIGRSTRHPLGSVASGTVITAILQSSSMVSLIVLAFASAGMIQLYNAVGVILGANLGTTFTGWVVATIGFKMDLEAFALPCFGLGALIYVFSEPGSKIRATSGITMGLGLLVFGLSLMKDSVSDIPEILSQDILSELSLPAFLLVGMLLTAIIQSSSATTLIALTALNAGIIDLSSAGALVVGADIGTTSTTALGSLRAAPVAKQLAMAHICYNLVVDAIAFLVLIPLLPAILAFFELTDPLYGLVFFHSLFNLLGLFIFLPILKPFSRWLSTFFVEKKVPYTRYLHTTPAEVPEAAKVALHNELNHLLVKVLAINIRNLKLDTNEMSLPKDAKKSLESAFELDEDFNARYEKTKLLEGEIFHYASKVRVLSRLDEQKLDSQQDVLGIFIDCSRDAIYSMKTLKDVRENLLAFRQLLGQSEEALAYLDRLKHQYEVLVDLLFTDHKTSFIVQKIGWLRMQNEKLHDELHDFLLNTFRDDNQEHQALASVMNTNREIWHANKNLFDAFEHLNEILNTEGAEHVRVR